MFSTLPKISIISINYNNADGLSKTIQSIVSQTYENIEYIVIDGGSEDNSKSIIQANEDGINHWVSETDTGIYNAMNKGIRAAKGAYLLFINSGDVLVDNNVIAKAVDEGLTHDLVCANLIVLTNLESKEWLTEDELSFRTFLYSTIPHPCTFIKADLFEQVGLYNEKLSIVSDWEFFLLATCKYNCSYKHINLFLTAFSDGGISSEPQNYAKIDQERADVLSTHFPRFLKDYEENKLLKREMDKIRYFLRIRSFVKGLFKRQKH